MMSKIVRLVCYRVWILNKQKLGMKPNKIRGYKTIHTKLEHAAACKPEIVFRSLRYLNLRIRCVIDLRFYSYVKNKSNYSLISRCKTDNVILVVLQFQKPF